MKKYILNQWKLITWIVFGTLVFSSLLNSFGQDYKVETNILRLLPSADSNTALNIAFERFTNKNMSKLVFLLSAKDEKIAEMSAEALIDELEASEWIGSVSKKIGAIEQQELGEHFYQYRFHLMSEQDRKLLLSDNYQIFIDDAIEVIYSPLSVGYANFITSDPFLLSYRYLKHLKSNTKLAMENGYLKVVEENRINIFISAELNVNPFEQTAQQDIMQRMSNLQALWASNNNPVILGSSNSNNESDIQFYKAGALFYADYAFRTARAEISTIGVSSLLLIIMLVVFTFRSAIPLILTSFALLFGISTGLAVVLALFKEIHLITLIFGASLVGVAVDYCFHFLVVNDVRTGKERIARILPAISLGLLSSVVGYSALMTTPFPGLQQMALFCIAGLSGAYLTVVLLFPSLSLNTRLSPGLLVLCNNIHGRIAMRSRYKVWLLLWLFPLIALFFINKDIFIENVKLTNPDDIRQFQSVDPDLKFQENTIKSIIAPTAANQFFLVKGKSIQELLMKLEWSQSRLQTLADNGDIEDFINISNFIPSVKQQKINHGLFENLFRSNAINNYLGLGLLSSEQFQLVVEKMLALRSQYLELNTWLSSMQGKAMSNLWLGEIEGNYYAIVPIKGIRNIERLEDLDDDVIFIDKVSQISDIFTKYREQTSYLLMVAVIAIGALLSLRYGILRALFIISSPVFSMSLAVIVLSIFGITLTLFNTLALFLILGVGIDYGLFFAESKSLNANTLLAIILSAFTTIFSFGLLGLSETVAISSFGMTMLVGISASLVLSPIIGSLVVQNAKI